MSESTPDADLRESLDPLIGYITNQFKKYTFVHFLAIQEFCTRSDEPEINLRLIYHSSVSTGCEGTLQPRNCAKE